MLAPKGPFGRPGGPRRALGGQIWSQLPSVGPTGLVTTHFDLVLGLLREAQNAPFGVHRVPGRAIQHHAWYCMVLYCIVLYCIVLHGIAWYFMVVYCIGWYRMILQCCTVLYFRKGVFRKFRCPTFGCGVIWAQTWLPQSRAC